MRKNIRQKIIIALAGVFLAFFVFVLFLEIINLNKVAYGAEIGGVKIGGKTTQEAEKLLKERFVEWEKQKIEFIYQGSKFSALPPKLGISLGLDQSVKAAYILGRNKNIFVGIWQQLVLLTPFGKNNLMPIYTADANVFDDFAKTNFALFENPTKNASLVYNFKTRCWETTEAKNGIIFDRGKIKSELNENIFWLQSKPIELVLIEDIPEVLENETGIAKEIANNLLENAPYEIFFNGKSWKIDKATLLDWVEFVPANFSFAHSSNQGEDDWRENKILSTSLSQEKIKDVLIEIAPSVNQEPINAQLAFENEKVSAFFLSQDGIRLETDKSAKKIEEEILEAAEANNGAPAIELVVKRTSPQISTENIDTLGLTALIGKGESNFAGSPKNRTHNIKVGAAKMNGLLIRPGEEFSFANYIGEIGAKQGYLPELVIKKNKTIPEYGGGICQVSTTIFRAAINSGLKITERHAHAFPVKYYNPQGFDATIYPPRPDLRFINDTSNNILLQAKIEGTKITFEIYGTADGREAKIKGPTIISSSPDGAMKTILYQQIWRDGKMEREDKFFSNYKSPTLYPVERNPLE